MARKFITVPVTLSVKAGVSLADAKRELRTRVNELCCYSSYLEESDVRVKRVGAGRKVRA